MKNKLEKSQQKPDLWKWCKWFSTCQSYSAAKSLLF